MEEVINRYQLPDCVKIVGTGNLTTGSGDQLYLDKSTKHWRRWVYYKQKKKIPELCVNLYNNKLLIEKLEKAAICVGQGLKYAGEDRFSDAMKEAENQLSNPRSDSAEAVDRLGKICMQANLFDKAIRCFEISLHMRKMIYYDKDNELTLFSLILLGMSWAGEKNYHRSITVLEKALNMAENLYSEKEEKSYGQHIVEILLNLGSCWENLREHHTALSCYEKSEKLRRKLLLPKACQTLKQ